MNGIDKLKKLQNEIKKCTSLRMPESTKKDIADSLKLSIDESLEFPLKITATSLPNAFSKIMDNQKLTSQHFAAIGAMVDVLCYFDDESLIIIIKSIEQILSQIDDDLSLKLLQVIPTLLLKHVETLDIISSIFSISMSLISHQNSVVSTSAFAATQQVITILFKSSETVQINDKTSVVVEKQQFSHSVFAVSFLLLRDFADMAQNRKPRFIRVNSAFPAISELWDTILISNHEFISNYSFLYNIVESTLVLPFSSQNISFICTTFRFFPEKFIESAQKFVFKAMEKINHYLIVFLRVVFMRRPDLCLLFDSSLILKIITVLDEICLPSKKSPLLNLSLKPLQAHDALSFQNKELFARTFSVEFVIILISALGSVNDTNSLTPRLTQLWPSIMSLLLKGVRLCDQSYTDIIFRSYNMLLSISSQCGINECSSVLLRILCAIVAKQKLVRNNSHPVETLSNNLLHSNTEGLGFKRKRAMAYQMLLSLLYNNPLFFSKFYPRLFVSLGMYQRAKIDPKFTGNIETEELVKMCEVLCKGTPFCISFLKDVILCNQDRFSSLWPPISQNLSFLIKESDSADVALELFSDVVNQNFDESMLSIFSDSFEKVNLKRKITIVNLIRSVLGHSSNKIEKNWGEILAIILPTHCETDSELLGSAFACLSVICNDHFQKLSETDMQTCISSVFEFAAQRVDINISLSALGLLWVITPFIHQISRFWKRILSETLVFFNDTRSDVATCALRTFFSLLSSNMGQMPSDIYNHLIAVCFIPLLMTFSSFRPESWSVQQLALSEICHYACAFWSQFELNHQFVSNFWVLLIEKQQQFVINCENQEINVSALQFYEESFKCPKITKDLRKELLLSFSIAVNHLMTNEAPNSLVISSLGRFFSHIVPTQKVYLTSKQLEIWLNLIELIALTINTPNLVNMTIQKVIDSAYLLFPLTENGFAKQILQTYSSVFEKAQNTHLKSFMCEYIIKVLKNNISPEDVLSMISNFVRLFQFTEADPLILFIIEFNFNLNVENCQTYFDIFEQIGKQPKYGAQVKKALIHVLPLIGKDSQFLFINENSENIDVLISTWNLLCDAKSSAFNKGFSDICSIHILNYIFEKLEMTDKEATVKILEFLENSETKKTKVGDNEQCSKWHIYGVIPHLIPLLNDNRDDVRGLARKVFSTIHADMGQLVKI